MYLKTVELQGFKSFANRTKIEFNHPVTAVVGPNGSGKSNISDAIMWALGEQSAKSLRGNKMEDVIFSGTGDRKPLGFAHVTITFDNRDGWLPIDYEEVTVSRKMYRSGESEFKINQKNCRLKDIKELFMDTGIGKDGYSLIGQGKIDSVLSTKPEDRRNIFEEAAGISKYKVKKEEAERKLSRTRDNILRSDDILSEIKARERKLKREVNRFNQYDAVQKKVFDGEELLLGDELLRIEQEEKEAAKHLNLLEEKIGELHHTQKVLAEDREDHRRALVEAKEEIKKKTEEILKLREENNGIFTEEKIAEERARDLEELIRNADSRIKELDDRFQKLSGERELLIRELEKSEILWKSLMEEKDRLKKISEETKEKRREMGDEVRRLEEQLKTRETFLNETEKKIASTSGVREEKEERKRRLEDYTSRLNDVLDSLEKERKDLQSEENILNEKIPVAISETEEIKARLASLSESLAQKESRGNDLNLLKKEREQSLIFHERAMENLDGFYKSVRSFIKYTEKHDLFNGKVIGPVANLFQIDEKYETAISVALGGGMQNIVIENDEDSREMIDVLKKNKLGRVTFLPLNVYKKKYGGIRKKEPPRPSLGYLADYLECEERLRPIFRGLLGDTVLTENYRDGLSLHRRDSGIRRIISLEGDVFRSQGSITGGSVYKGNTDMVNRSRRVEEERSALKDVETELSELREDYQRDRKKFSETEEFYQKRQQELLQLREDKVELSEKKQRTELSLESNKEHGKQYFRELETLGIEIQQDRIRERELEGERIKYSESRESLEKILEEVQEQYNHFLNEEEEKEEEFHRQELRLKDEENKRESLGLKRNHIDSEIRSILTESEERKTDLKNSKINLKKLKVRIQELNKSSGDLKNRLNILREEEKSSSFKLNELEEKGKEYEARWESLEEELRSCVDEEKEEEFRKEKLELEKMHRLTGFREKYGIEPTKKSGTTPLNEEEKGKLTADLQKNKKKLEKIGGIDPNAPEEYRSVTERLANHEKQREDLKKGAESLERIINNLDREMRGRFKDSFQEISDNFNEIFQELFHGGKATIELEEGNLLEAGIEIKSQPPGKKFQSLSLLSGGERTLTAIALLFALLKKRPAPFCILDEIDANLDDSNINRYISYLDTIDDIQFIMITHRKPTMEIADILYGVTMEEMGISKIVPMEIEAYEEE